MNAALLSRAIGYIFLPKNTEDRSVQIVWTVLRVVAGFAMIHNGLDKLADISGFADAYVSAIGLPFPIFFAYCAAFAEAIGAPLLLLGMATRPAAAALCSTMIVAMYHHIHVAGFNIPYLELSMVYSAIFLFFTINGGGRFSIDHLIARSINRSRVASLEATLQEKISLVAKEKASRG